MVNSQRMRRWAIVAVVLGCTAVTGAPAALAAGGDGVISGGGGPNPEEIRLKRERAWVDAAELSFSKAAYDATMSAAEKAVGEASCDVSAEAAGHLALSTTWPEVSPNGAPPSPMTLSRYDDQSSLADPEGRSEGLFFNPGVGMWQLDSAGLGADETAYTAIDSVSAAGKMVPHMLGTYCDAVNGGSSSADARAAAWQPWHACDEGACESVFQQLQSDGVTTDDSVDRFGGAEQKTCTFQGAEYDCLFVDPSKAQGENAWTDPGYGPAPVPDPFYVFTYSEGGTDYEVRYWMAADTGADTDVSASRELGVDAREKLSWAAETGAFCDVSAQRGSCDA